MRVAVTGGAGYIGSHATAELVRLGHQVTVIDDFSAGHRAALPERAVRVIEADIGDTSAAYAKAAFDVYGAHCITVSPYLGEEAVAPLLARVDRFAYVLCRTSNPGAAELQGLIVAADDDAGHPAEPLYARVARRVASWGPGGTVGLVVGATAPVELSAIRDLAPGLAFLVPGVGAQGGDETAVLAHGRASAAPAGDRPGGGLLVNVSRGIAGAAGTVPSGDRGEAIASAARDWAARLPVLP